MKHFAPTTYFRGVLLSAISVFAIGWPCGSPAATIVVTNLASNGSGTLRSALTNAHNGDVITFAVTGFITNKVAGGLAISNSISIVGPGSNLLTITGTNWFSGFQVINGATSSISGLTFYRCTGAINNSANLTVSNCLFTGCYRGGGINNSSNLLLVGCTFADCRGGYGASAYSESFPGDPGGSGANGGALINSGTLSAVNCQFTNNTAGWGGNGASGDVPAFYRSIPGMQVTAGGNGGHGGHGGAVYDVGTATFTNCTFGWNTSGMGGSGGQGGSGVIGPSPNYPTYPGTGKRGGNAGHAGNGSAVYSLGGARFVSCTFFNNSTGSGGSGGNGGDGYGYIYPNSSAYSGGDGGNAGNAGSGTLYCTGACQLVACTFYNNHLGSAGYGGNGGNGVNNVSIPGGNGGNGGNAGNGGSGGAICGPTNNASFTLQNLLIAQNTATYAGSIGSGGSGGSGYVYGSNGLPGTNATDGTGPDLAGKFTSGSHNFISLGDGSTGFTNSVRSDIVGSGSPMDALLGDLADNHGPVMTCALLAGSPALDAGDDTLLASNIVTDARGYARKAGAHVDIGAYEHQAALSQFFCRSRLAESGVVVSMTNTPGALFSVIGSDDLTLPVVYWPVLGTMKEVSPGQFEWLDTTSADYSQRFFLIQTP